MYTYALTTAILAGLTAAAPLAQGTVTITVSLALGSDDSSSTRDIPFGKLAAGIIPPASKLVVSSSSGVSSDQITCQAFSDAAGTMPIGSTFGSTTLGDGTSLVTVGSAFCSDAAGVAAFSAGSAASTVTPPSSGLTEVDIKLDFGNSEGATIGKVPVNGQLVPTLGTFIGSVAFFKAAIQTANAQGVTCTAFGDVAGQQKLTDVLGDGKDVFFNQAQTDVPVGAFKCVAA